MERITVTLRVGLVVLIVVIGAQAIISAYQGDIGATLLLCSAVFLAVTLLFIAGGPA